MNINGKTAIITGASAGIGKAFAEALVRKGATVYGLARSGDKLERLQERLGQHFKPVVMDITDKESVFAWVKETFATQQADILINNAGFGAFASVDELEPQVWDDMLATNLSGVFYLTHALVPNMKANAEVTHILNIASVAGLMGNPQLSAYNATKFGLRGFSEALFKELRGFGIKVTCVYPGSIATDFFEKVGMETHDNMMRPEDVAKTVVNVIETPDNFLIDEITLRPLNPKKPEA